MINSFIRKFALVALSFERKVDHHDGVLLHDADEQDDADKSHDTEFHAEEQQREDRTDGSRRQSREDRERMNITLVQHAEHDIDGDERR